VEVKCGIPAVQVSSDRLLDNETAVTACLQDYRHAHSPSPCFAHSLYTYLLTAWLPLLSC
jgi:hypothetical protein